jgi:hypothetical protein
LRFRTQPIPDITGYYKSSHWLQLRAAALKRDGDRCTTKGCGRRAKIVGHIKSRPHVAHPTSLDVLGNVTSQCRDCDNQNKELADRRRRQGIARARGCDADGWPKA